MARRRTSEERLARHREEKRLRRQRRLERKRAKRMRVARAFGEMQAGKSMSAAARAAHTTPAAMRAETTPASLPVHGGRVTAASSSRVRLDLGRAGVLTTEGVMPARLRTLRDWELWQAQDRLINLAAEGR